MSGTTLGTGPLILTLFLIGWACSGLTALTGIQRARIRKEEAEAVFKARLRLSSLHWWPEGQEPMPWVQWAVAIWGP